MNPIPKPNIVRSEDQSESLLQWEDRYKLLCLDGAGSNFEMPGSIKYPIAEDLKKIADLIIFVDRGGGGRVFSQWHLKNVNTQNSQSYVVYGNQWNESLIRVYEEGSIVRDTTDQSKRLIAILSQMGKRETPDGFFEAFHDIKEEVEKEEAGKTKHLNLVFYNPSAMGERAGSLVQALRSVRDSFQKLEFPLHVTMINSSQGPFLSTLENSDYLPIATCFRLAFFNLAEIGALAKKILAKEITDSLARQIHKRIGGHPYLTQVLLLRLKNIGAEQKTQNDIEKAYRQMKQNPPDITRRWMEDLKDILLQRPELQPELHAYALGHTLGPDRFPPSAIERPLFIGGWVCRNQEGRWGISSDYHAHIARKVLLSMGVTQ